MKRILLLVLTMLMAFQLNVASAANVIDVDNISIDNIKLGDTYKIIQSRYGNPQKVIDYKIEGTDFKMVQYENCYFTFVKKGHEYLTDSFTSNDPSHKTSQGLYAGMKAADALKLMGEPSEKISVPGRDTDLVQHVYQNASGDKYMYFEVGPNGKVVEVAIGKGQWGENG